MMNKKGLTISMIFEASSANYGEGIGNISSLKNTPLVPITPTSKPALLKILFNIKVVVVFPFVPVTPIIFKCEGIPLGKKKFLAIILIVFLDESTL